MPIQPLNIDVLHFFRDDYLARRTGVPRIAAPIADSLHRPIELAGKKSPFLAMHCRNQFFLWEHADS